MPLRRLPGQWVIPVSTANLSHRHLSKCNSISSQDDGTLAALALLTATLCRLLVLLWSDWLIAQCFALLLFFAAAESVTITIISTKDCWHFFLSFFLPPSYPSLAACWLVHRCFWWPFSNNKRRRLSLVKETLRLLSRHTDLSAPVPSELDLCLGLHKWTAELYTGRHYTLQHQSPPISRSLTGPIGALPWLLSRLCS